MKIFVKAKPGARISEIQKVDENHYVVSVKEPPIQGKANVAIIEALAEYFQKRLSQVRIVSGFTSRQKIVEII